ncbi:MAG: energy-coupling factor ABC transporter permease [Gemmatimonadota bacterium]
MAHIPDGFLSPAVIAGTVALSGVAIAVAARRSARRLDDRQAPLLGALTAFVFAAQMLNFPLGAGTSAHLLGGVLLGVVAGPWAGMLALFSVLLVQALLFQDGGITALGANTLNLAVIGAGGGYLLYRWQLALFGDGRHGRLAAAGIAAFLSTVAAGLAAGLELGLSGLVPVGTAVAAVGAAHLIVGVAEGALTVGILAAVLRSRPELLRDRAPAPSGRAAVAVGTVAVAAGAAAVAWASDLPDALETALARLGLADGAGGVPGPFAGYTAPFGGPWAATAAGLLVGFAIAWILVRLAGRTSTTP